MLFIANYNHQLFFTLLIVSLLLAVFLRIVFLRGKKEGFQKLSVIFNELEKENQLATKYKGVSTKITSLEKVTQQKIRTIKVDIQNINFTLSEIF